MWLRVLGLHQGDASLVYGALSYKRIRPEATSVSTQVDYTKAMPDLEQLMQM